MRRVLLARATGYASAVAVPVALTYVTWGFALPSFVFEHLIVLLVVAVTIPWGLGPGVVAAVVSVLSDNVLLREPFGQPTIGGYRDVLDLLLFAIVAVVVSGLMRRAYLARHAAEESADRERRANEERDRLIATIAHDLATPLSVLTHTVELARRRGGSAEVDLTRLLARLETASARATSLVRMLSDVQALESADFELRRARHDLRALVMPIAEMMDRLSDRHPIITSLPDHPVTIDADGDRVQRVLENLLGNAIKYSPGGGAVEVTVGLDGSHATLDVRDHGIGIAPEALPRIFDRAYRSAEASTQAPGLGLGLNIAHQLVTRHGGTIEARAAAGGGTTVLVRLPLAAEATLPAERVAAVDRRVRA